MKPDDKKQLPITETKPKEIKKKPKKQKVVLDSADENKYIDWVPPKGKKELEFNK